MATSNLLTRHVRHSTNATFPAAANDANTKLAMIFNQAPSESTGTALERWLQNLANGASNNEGDLYYPENLPTVLASAGRFREDNMIQTKVSGDVCTYALVIVRLEDAGVGTDVDGDTILARGFVMGNFGNTLNRGWALILNSQLQMRLSTYNAAGAPINADIPYASAPLLRQWRLFEIEITQTAVTLRDLTAGTSGTNALAGGASAGSQKITVGGRETSGSDYDDDGGSKDIAWLIVQGGATNASLPDAAGKLALQEQARVVASLAGIVFGV